MEPYEQLQRLLEDYAELKEHIKNTDRYFYERWKAGEFAIDRDIISMYPTIEQFFE